MRNLGIGIAIVGGLISFFTSMIFGLIILGLGLIVVSLNKGTDKVRISTERIITFPLKEKEKGYFHWSKTKLGKWSFFVDTLVVLSVTIIGSLIALVFVAYLTADIEEMKDFNCGSASIVTNLILEPLFDNRSMYNDFCVYN